MGRAFTMSRGIGPEEAAAAEKYVLRTPQARAGFKQDQKWHPRGPLPNAYMSPVDFTLSPMSMRLMRGNRRKKVLVSAKMLDLPEHPGFVTEEYSHVFEAADAREDKENCGVVRTPASSANKKVEALKAGGSGKKGLSPASVNRSPSDALNRSFGAGGKRPFAKGLSPAGGARNEMSPRNPLLQSR